MKYRVVKKINKESNIIYEPQYKLLFFWVGFRCQFIIDGSKKYRLLEDAIVQINRDVERCLKKKQFKKQVFGVVIKDGKAVVV